MRNPGLDALKVVAAIAVVFLHCVSPSVRDFDLHRGGWWIANFVNSFSRWTVPAFVMISGAVLLPIKSSESTLFFYRKRIPRILFVTIFWTLFYFAFQYFSEQSIGVRYALGLILKGRPYYHLWYLYMIVILYLATPFLSAIVEKIEPEALFWLIFALFVISVVGSFDSVRSRFFWILALPYLSYFLAGYYLKNHALGFSAKFLVVIIILAGVLISLLTAGVLKYFGVEKMGLVESNFNPLVVLMSLAIFLLFLKLTRENAILSRLSVLGFGVYLLHPLFLKILGSMSISADLIHPALGVPITVFLAVVLSGGVTLALLNFRLSARLVR